ncbi:hypothetical protein BC834DRAFT_910143 [Gloeopeniophorella convolvens]|nr:hypothetical protein BC834DRAFT_910143 [Gloeopeniophorella convolvens]
MKRVEPRERIAAAAPVRAPSLPRFAPSAGGADRWTEPRIAVDREIDELSQQLLSLRAQHNALLPISTLPIEAIASVLRSVALERPTWRGHLGWIETTHVCRTWRNVAHKTPILWQSIAFELGQECVTQMLACSRTVPLTITILPKVPLRYLEIIPGLICRTTELTFQIDTDKNPHVKQIIGSPAPLLNLMFLEHTTEDDTMDPIEPPHGLKLFAGCAPKLAALRLERVFIPWRHFPHTPLLSRLQIVVHDFGLSESQYNIWNQLLDVLSGCPAFSTLILDGCLPRAVPILLSVKGRSVSLPKLRQLTLGGAPGDIAVVFESLIIPHWTPLNILCRNCGDLDRNDPRLVLPRIFEHFPYMYPGFSSLGVTVSDSVVEVIGRRGPCQTGTEQTLYNVIFKEHQTPSKASLRLSFHSSPQRRSVIHQMPLLLPALPFDWVDCVYFDAKESISHSDWVEALRKCKEVTYLNVRGAGAISILRHLAPVPVKNVEAPRGGNQNKDNSEAPPTASSDPPPLPKFVFPKLREVLAVDVDFTTKARPHPPKLPGFYRSNKSMNQVKAAGSKVTYYDLLVTALEWRRYRVASPVEELYLVNCTLGKISEKDLIPLIEAVRHRIFRDGDLWYLTG